jgi:GPH family glycoside/pentoside/hexuronide:cation symporter
MEFPLNRQIGYASGNFGKSLLWTSLDYLLLFYLTEVAGLPVAWAGVIILVSLLWDAAINPFIGYWIDRRASRGRDYRPFLRWAPIASGCGFVALFWLPSDQSHVNAAYLLVALFGFRTAYALLDVPHNALLAHMPVSSAMRMRLAGMRFFFSSLGGLVVAVTVAPQFAEDASPSTRDALLSMSMVAAVLLCLTVWQSLRPSREAIVERDHASAPLSPSIFMTAIFRSEAALLYLVLAGLFATTTPLFAKILPYYLSYVTSNSTSLASLLTALTVGQIVALPVWTALLSRFQPALIGTVALSGLAFSLLVQVPAMEIQSALTVLVTASVGFFLSGAVQVIWGLSGDVADRIASKTGMRVDGGVLAFLTLVQKAALGLGAITAGIALEASGFESGAQQSDMTARMIQIFAMFVPAFGAIAAALILTRLCKALGQK